MKDELSSIELGEKGSFKDGHIKGLLSGSFKKKRNHLNPKEASLLLNQQLQAIFSIFFFVDICLEKSEKSDLNLSFKIKD